MVVFVKFANFTVNDNVFSVLELFQKNWWARQLLPKSFLGIMCCIKML